MKHRFDDVIVIGGGHAGCEAAAAAARMGATVKLITMKSSDIGTMSCNPAIGGIGKGHLVREIDALDGLMGHAADRAGIQFRLLNRKKGPAVQGPRAQADRDLYRLAMNRLILNQENLEVIFGEVVDFVMTGDRVKGIRLKDGSIVPAGAVVLTTGTFLGGTIHIGQERRVGGRVGDEASVALANRLREMASGIGRLKTGTPPRIESNSIHWAQLGTQPGDTDPVLFSFLSKGTTAQQISCGVTETNATTHAIIRENIGKSAMYGGQIEGVGPRYCPSIEDKVTRFADKDSHLVFLEPEGLTSNLVYPNGISTSLPVEIQDLYVRSIRGLEEAVIAQPGYAIEYDYLDPRGLNHNLCLGGVEDLYLAGQINGTTGYEEAAGQGLIAGLNAAASVLGLASIKFRREDSYLGVMIDDLVTQGVSEPYRMFTSRAEYRLTLRADNADQRLTPIGQDLGCVGPDRWRLFSEKREGLDSTSATLSQTTFTSRSLSERGFNLNADGPKRSAREVLALPGVDVDVVVALDPEFSALDLSLVEQVARDALYENYTSRQEREVKARLRDEQWLIQKDFDYSALSGLSNELVEKLSAAKPEDLGQAGRIDGMTPAALALILAGLKRLDKKSA